MKIAFFTQNLGNYISGGRMYPWTLAHALANAGHELLVISDWEPVFDRDFIKCPNRHKMKFHYDLNFGSKNKSIMNELKTCDVFVASPMLSLDYAVTIGKMYGKKIAALVYEPFNMIDEAINDGIEIPALDESTIRDFTRQLSKVNMIICNTKLTLGYMKEWFPNFRGRIEYCYNGFNTIIADKVEKKTRENSIVYLSRTMKYKGFGDIPYIFGQNNRNIKIHYISGSIDMKNPVHRDFFKLCEQAKLDLVIHDRITEVEKFSLLASCKALFFPSRFEGFGIPPAEAFYMGTPVICYDLPILKEIYKDYPHYAPCNDIDAMGQLIDELFKDDNLLFRDIDKAQAHVQFGEFNNLTNSFNKLICSLAGHKYESIDVKIKTILDEPIKETKASTSWLKTTEEIEVFEASNFGNLDLIGKLKSKYIIIKNKDIELDLERIKGEIVVRMDEGNYDFMTFNHTYQSKEVRLLESSLDAEIVKVGHIGGVVACRKEALIRYQGAIVSSNNWELKLLIEARNDKWFHSNLIGFKINRLPDLDQERRSIIINRFLEDEQTYWAFGENLGCSKNRAKTLVIIPARTNQHMPKLVDSLAKLDSEIYKCVLCVHEPDGKYNDEVIKTFSKVSNGSVLKFDGQFNYSKMNNKAFEEFGKDCKYVVLCNDDIVLKDNTLDNLILGFKYRFKDIGIVGAKLLYPNDNDEDYKMENSDIDKRNIQHAGVVLLSDKRCTHFCLNQKSNKLSVNYMKIYPAVTFGLVAIDAECYETLLLREDYPNDLNDIDFCLRAKKKGWDTLYNPYAVAIHCETGTRKQFKMLDDNDNRKRFKEEYKELLSKQISFKELQQIQYNLT